MMLIKQKVAYVVSLVRRFPVRSLLAAAAFIFILTYFFAFILDKPVQFSYAGGTCVGRLTLLPGLQRQTGAFASYKLTHEHITKLGSMPLFSTQDCIAPIAVPKQGVTRVSSSPWGGFLFKTTFAISVDAPPVANTSVFAKPIPIGKSIKIPFNKADTINKYRLRVKDKQSDCLMKGKVLECDIASLSLEQGRDYQLALERSFKGAAKTVLFQKPITTLPATNVTKSSVSTGQVVYDRPTSLQVSFDKEVISMEVKLINKDTNSAVTFTKTTEGSSLKIQLAKELDRNSHYQLTVDKLEARDGSTLPTPYIADFFVSGGPKIAGVNIGSSRAGLSQTVVLTFDQPLSDRKSVV